METTELMQAQQPVDLNKLLQITQNNTMSNAAISKQMGIIVDTVANHGTRIDIIESRLTSHERTVVLTNYQRKAVFNAVGNRVKELVGYPSKYYGRFKAQCWRDAKKHSKMAQEYQDTLQIDYDEVMSYIGSWYPEGYSGVEAYIEHLDSLHD